MSISSDAVLAKRPSRRSPWLFAAGLLLVVFVVGILTWSPDSANSTDTPGPLMTSADLTDAGLTAATLDNVDLSAAILERTDFTAADLRGADLSFSKGVGAVFRNSCLRGTRWDGSTVTAVVLDGADLSGADMGRSQINVASTKAAMVDDETVWGPEGAPPGTVRVKVGAAAPCR